MHIFLYCIALQVDDCPLSDERWHSVTVCHSAAKRPFGVAQMVIYIDGREKRTANLKYPTFSEPLAYFQLAGPLHRTNSPSLSSDPASKLSLKAIITIQQYHRLLAGFERTLTFTCVLALLMYCPQENIKDAIKQSVPGVWALPQYLRGSGGEPGTQWTMLGMEDVMWGPARPLHGQLATTAIWEESLGPNQVAALHGLGPDRGPGQEGGDVEEGGADLAAKLVILYSPRVCSHTTVTNLAPAQLASYDGHTLATPITTHQARDSIHCLGGVQVLFPLLEPTMLPASHNCPSPAPAPASRAGSVEGGEGGEWELLPSAAFSEWRLERNPVSGCLTLLRNLVTGHPGNLEQLGRGGGVAVLGSLLHRLPPALLDVAVLMSVQLLVELASSADQARLLYQLHQSVLLDWRVWARAPAHLQVGHAQYVAQLVRADRKYFRKKFGVQFLLDVMRQHYSEAGLELGEEDCREVRGTLLGLVQYHLTREVSAGEVAALVSFLLVCRSPAPLAETLEMVTSYLESKQVRDQMFLLLLEPRQADLLYCVLLEPGLQPEARAKLYKLALQLLRTTKVSARHKTRLQLGEAGWAGWLQARTAPPRPPLGAGEAASLTSLMMGGGAEAGLSCYAGLLALCHHLQLAELPTKLELARRLLGLVYSQPAGAGLVARLPGWQGCLARLLVREVVRPEESVQAAEEQEEIGPASPPGHLVREAGKVLADTGSRVRAAVGEVAQSAQWRVAAKVTLPIIIIKLVLLIYPVWPRRPNCWRRLTRRFTR